MGTGILIGYYLQSKKEKKNNLSEESKINLDELIVIIPFRNEENNLEKLINSIENLDSLPLKFLFIDDHSTDNSIQKINKLTSRIPYEILSLPESKKGKKEAIRFGVNHQKCDFNLTWDADIEIPNHYFIKIAELQDLDLYVLPVIMKGQKVIENYFESDHAITNAINTAVSGLSRPFIASGANLLIKQKSFFEVDGYQSHSHISSGDDLFLLRDFRNNNKKIALSTDKNLAVTTNTPTTINEFFNQRLRWIGKGKKVNDNLSNGLAVIAFIINMIFLVIFCYYLFQLNWNQLITFFLLKSTIDLIVYFPYFQKINRLKTCISLPLYALIQPIYLIILCILLITYEPKWKDRKVNI